MRKNQVESVWLPIKPVLYEQWRWLNQEPYGRYKQPKILLDNGKTRKGPAQLLQVPAY